jgi:hypothetical protein
MKVKEQFGGYHSNISLRGDLEKLSVYEVETEIKNGSKDFTPKT